MYGSCEPLMIEASEKRDRVEETGTPLEPQLKKGIAPYFLTASKAATGNTYGAQPLEPRQSANGEENSIIESPLPATFWNFVTAFMSQGASLPVNCFPIHAPQ